MKALKARSLLNAEIISGSMIHHCLNSSFENLHFRQIYENFVTFVYIHISVFLNKIFTGTFAFIQISLTTYDCTFYDPILRSEIQFIFILKFNSYMFHCFLSHLSLSTT